MLACMEPDLQQHFENVEAYDMIWSRVSRACFRHRLGPKASTSGDPWWIASWRKVIHWARMWSRWSDMCKLWIVWASRSVTSQIFNLECYTLDHHCMSYFYCILVDPRNSKQLKDPQRELEISLLSFLSFLKFWKEDHLVLLIFLL